MKLPKYASNIENETLFAVIDLSLVEHPRFSALSNSAQLLYERMLLYSGMGTAGTGEFGRFEFPHKQYSKIFNSKATFRKARDELIDGGFIRIAENNANLRKPNVYEFIEDWKKDK